MTLDGASPACHPGEGCRGRHRVELVARVPRAGRAPATVLCGADLVADEMPAEAGPGDLVAVAGTGAYHGAEGCYVGRSALVAVTGGQARTLESRFTVPDLLSAAAR